MMKRVKPKRKSRPRVNKPRTADELLKIIDEFLVSAEGYEPNVAWNILTALRGPDSDSIEMKAITTEFIRRAAFPKAANSAYRIGASFAHSPSVKPKPDFHEMVESSGMHFTRHIHAAWASLDMMGRSV